MEFLELLLKWVEILGTAAFAASGAMVAIERGTDLFGVLFLGVVTALGGGTLRDILLGEFPPRMFYSYSYLCIAAATALIVFIAAGALSKKYHEKYDLISRICNYFDALGLAVFSVTGVTYAIRAGFFDNPFLCVFLGMTTGIGGGVLRDMMTGTVPFVLKKRIYAVAAIVGSLLYWALLRVSLSQLSAMGISVAVVFLIRVLATKFRWDLPKIEEHTS